MKKIKIRVWDKKYGNMIYNIMNVDLKEMWFALEIGDESRFVPMMNTCMKDYDNYEIYEGDILSDVDDGRLSVIEYIDNAFCVVEEGVILSQPEQLEARVKIGNIYKNPELKDKI